MYIYRNNITMTKTIKVDCIPFTGNQKEDQKFWDLLEKRNILLNVLNWHGPGGGAPVVQFTGKDEDLRYMLAEIFYVDEEDMEMYII